LFGEDLAVALAIIAAVGNINRFGEPWEARELSRPQSERPAIGTKSRYESVVDHQDLRTPIPDVRRRRLRGVP
jgi:hypothetical protein